MKHTWLATRNADIHVQIDIPDFPLNQHGDKELVQSFLQHGFRQPQLGSLHRCQMYLQVLQLSDITMATGDRLLTTNWRDYSPIPSEYKWPAATKPSQSDWHMWDLALATAFQAGHNARLACPLGNYFLENNKGWYYDPLEQALWYRNDHQWSRHGKIPSRSRTQMFHRQGEPDSPTNQLCRATVQERNTKLTLTGSGNIDTMLSKPEGIAALAQHQYGQEWKWELTIVGNLQSLLEDILNGQGYAVSNGSFQAGRGAAAWIIEGRTNQNRIVGKCFSPSSDDGHSSFRSKLAGVYAMLFTLSVLLPQKTDSMTFHLACDGKSVLQRLMKNKITDPAEAHADLLSATRHLVHNGNLSVKFHHVKGHQDSKCFGLFTRDASLNIKADLLAKSKLENYQSGPSTFYIPWSQGVCYLGTK